MPEEKTLQQISKPLQRYLDQTLEIRSLSSPPLQDMKSAEDYRVTLLHNFRRIGRLASDNNTILRDYWFPLVEKEELLNQKEIDTLIAFREAMLNAVSMENIDLPLIYRETLRLLKQARDEGDTERLIIALDETVNVTNALNNMTQRLNPVSRIGYNYRDEGLKAARELITYLSPEKFVTLSDTAKSIVLVDARYISSLFDREDALGDYGVNQDDLNTLRAALALADDPFYLENAPQYNWVYHRFRSLQYISHIIINGNQRGFEGEQMKFILDCSLRLKDLWVAEQDKLSPYSTDDMIDLCVSRALYHAGKTDVEDYKKELFHIIMRRDDDDFSFHSNTLHLVLPVEYLCALDKNALSDREKTSLATFYKILISYVQRMPKKGSLTYLLTYLSDVLKAFIEVPDGPGFETLALGLIAALHPPTYVHTLSVAQLTRCITIHLIERKPELFTGVCGCETAQDVLLKSEEIIEFAYHAALCHDFGKLFVTEEIMTYGRDLLDEEFEMIKCHPSIGAHILERHRDTAQYAGVALLHHKWYDGTGGYPANRALDEMAEKTVIAIVTCADCLDASTDAVGRSYKKGKTADEFIEELKEGSGTRYAPYLAPLFEDKHFKKDIQRILSVERDENYRRAYRILSAYHGAS